MCLRGTNARAIMAAMHAFPVRQAGASPQAYAAGNLKREQ
jgi:hypothetical protein